MNELFTSVTMADVAYLRFDLNRSQSSDGLSLERFSLFRLRYVLSLLHSAQIIISLYVSACYLSVIYQDGVAVKIPCLLFPNTHVVGS